MDNPQGRVVSLTSANLAIVEVEAVSSCARCEAGIGCGAGLTTDSGGSRTVEAVIPPDVCVVEGDIVRLWLEPKDIFGASMLVYGLPLLGAVSIAVIAYRLGLGDAAAAIAALLGMAAGFGIVKLRLRNSACLRKFTPTVVARVASMSGAV